LLHELVKIILKILKIIIFISIQTFV